MSMRSQSMVIGYSRFSEGCWSAADDKQTNRPTKIRLLFAPRRFIDAVHAWVRKNCFSVSFIGGNGRRCASRRQAFSAKEAPEPTAPEQPACILAAAPTGAPFVKNLLRTTARSLGDKPGANQSRWRSRPDIPLAWRRSEEHTSELQSLRHLVCR